VKSNSKFINNHVLNSSFGLYQSLMSKHIIYNPLLMNNLEKYIKVVSQNLVPFVNEVLEYNHFTVISNFIASLKGGEILQVLKGAKKYKGVFLEQIAYGAIEISDSLEKLKSYEIYIDSYPYKGTRLSKIQHLRYTIENYLNDIFVLKNRTKEYLKKIKNLYSKDKNNIKIRKLAEKLLRKLPEKYDQIIKVRGIHVHKRRYTEPGIDQYEKIKLIANLYEGPSKDTIKSLVELQYCKIRKKWYKIIKDINKEIENDIDEIFELLYQNIFTSKGKIKYLYSDGIHLTPASI